MNIAEKFFVTNLHQMKNVLSLAEFKFGNNSEDYKFFKRETMNNFYNNLSELFKNLENDNVIERCKCKSNLRHGYTSCSYCHGAGYVNTK